MRFVLDSVRVALDCTNDSKAHMARRVVPTQPQQPPRLLMARNEARDKLISRREAGQALASAMATEVRSEPSFEEAKATYKKWLDFNIEMLRRMFDQPEYADKITHTGPNFVISMYDNHWTEDFRTFLERFKSKIDYLDGLAERIELIDVAPGVEETRRVEPSFGVHKATVSSGDKVFLVHGRDEEAKAIVARFLERCALKPIILHEQVDQGRTVIEKFEQESDVSFAVVLLTPDDVGGLNDPDQSPALQQRARQNVILELGYFVGKLGRDRVCAFNRGDIELPSDFSGVLYTPFGSDESWKIRLARELKAAGFDVDMNTALG